MKGKVLTALVVGAFSGVALADRTPWDWRGLTQPCELYESCENGMQRGLIVNDHGLVTINDPEDHGPAFFCYAPGTIITPEMQAALDAAMQGGFQSRYNIAARWTSTVTNPSTGGTGTPITLTWSFVPDGLSVGSGGPGGAGPSVLFQRMDQLFGGANRALWIAQFQACFDRWQAVSGVAYIRVRYNNNDWDDGAAWGSGGSSGLRGDVRISMKNIDGGGGILAYDTYPNDGDMVIDSSESWNSSGGTYRFLRNTVMHEHGHGLGFAHACPQNSTKLMEPGLNTNFDGPQQDEIRAVQRNYGDVNEANSGYTLATPIDPVAGGAQDPLPAGTSVFLGTVSSPSVGTASLLSIDRNGDQDYYSVVIDQPRLLRVRAFPVGSTYQDYTQNGDGSCNTGAANTNALAMADLKVTVYNTNGTSSLRVQDATLAGSEELVNNLLLGPAGTYFFAVSETGSPAQTQCYRLEVQALNTPLFVTTTNGTQTDNVHVTWSAIPDADSYQVLRSTVSTLGTGQIVGTVDGSTSSLDDSPPDGQTYYYSVRARQPGSSLYRFFVAAGVAGRANRAPIADAGPDQTLTDADNSGSENVALDGSGSSDDTGIVNYAWTEGATTLATSGSPGANVSLAVGVHTILLTVTDGIGATGTDTLVVTVNPGGGDACPWHAAGGCVADFNNSGGTPDDADVSAFFMAWANGDPCADANQSGGTPDDADIATFFSLWNNGGC